MDDLQEKEQLNLEALKKLCEKASEGDWVPYRSDNGWHYMIGSRVVDSVWEQRMVDVDFICAARTALPKLIEEVERSQWQPISSAPKDGSQIIVCIGSGHSATIGAAYHTKEIRYAEHTGRANEPEGWRWCSDRSKGGLINSTTLSWMPLPTPPALQSGGSNANS